MAAVTDPAALDKLLALLKKHDRRGNGCFRKEELSNLLRTLDSSGYWTDARLKVLFDGCQDVVDGDDIKIEAFVRGLYAEATTAASGVDYQALRADIVRLMESPEWDDGSYAPLLIRLAWHSSGTYDRSDGSGGSNGATMRHELEAKDPDNLGLAAARSLLEPVQAKYPGLSHADLWILAAYVAIEQTGGPRIRFTGGRQDAGPEKAPPNGRLPNPEKGLADGFNVDEEGRLEGWENSASHIREVFNRMGFGDREIVALITGGHVYGRCHNENSGYAGAWVENPTFFSNEYAADLIGDRWQAVTSDTRLSDGGMVPEEVRPSPGKRQYIDLTKYEPDEEEEAEKAARTAPDCTEYPPGQYRCCSQWVNCRELPDTESSIIGRFYEDSVLSLVSVKVFGTAARGMAERGGWVSIIASGGKQLFERIGDLDEQALIGRYRVIHPSGARLFPSPGKLEGDIGRTMAGEEVSCDSVQVVREGDQVGALYGRLASGNNSGAWMLIFTPEIGAIAELIVQNYNEKPRKPIKGQTGHQMMLVTDMVMLWDEGFKQYIEEYAEDEGGLDLLKKDFGEAFRRLTELGCPWSNDKVEPSLACPASGATFGKCPVMSR